jgi:GT2 family glycosyltransferase
MEQHKVYIIILNWNGIKDSIECLESVFKLNYSYFNVILVDNASEDNSIDIISTKYPQVHIIENKKNLGFAGGNNIAIRYAMEHSAEYVWLLNNDTVVEPDSLLNIVALADLSPDISMVSPLIYYYEDQTKKQFIGSYVDLQSLSVDYPDRNTQSNSIYKYSGKNVCLWGTALLIKTDVIKSIGYLKEEYFAYWEDTEYSLRSIKNGYRCAVCYTAKIYHKVPLPPITLPRGVHYYYLMHRNRILLGKEYLHGVINSFTFYRKYLANLIVDIGSCWQANDIKRLDACLNGAWHGLTNVTGNIQTDRLMPIKIKRIFMIIAKKHPFLIAKLIKFEITFILHEMLARVRSKMFSNTK